MKVYSNKNAFQWDAYRPLVDRIPARTGQGGCVSQHALGRGVCVSQYALGKGGVCLGVSPQGVSAGGGVADLPPVDRQTPMKI